MAGLASGGRLQWLHLGILAIEAVGFSLFMVLVAPQWVRRIEPRVAQFSTQNAPLIGALAICLFLSWLSVKIGMAAIIGAFFAGMMLADYAPKWNLLPRVGGITEFLAPYFFFAVGARLNVRLFSNGVFAAAVIISLLAIFSKVIGCGLPLLREGWPDSVAGGRRDGAAGRGCPDYCPGWAAIEDLGPASYAIVVFMTGVTTLIAPPLLRVLYHDELRGAGGGRATIRVRL